MGAHVDGYIAQACHTVVVGASEAELVKGKYLRLEVPKELTAGGGKDRELPKAREKDP
jgi:methionine aminopeptidase